MDFTVRAYRLIPGILIYRAIDGYGNAILQMWREVRKTVSEPVENLTDGIAFHFEFSRTMGRFWPRYKAAQVTGQNNLGHLRRSLSRRA